MKISEQIGYSNENCFVKLTTETVLERIEKSTELVQGDRLIPLDYYHHLIDQGELSRLTNMFGGERIIDAILYETEQKVVISRFFDEKGDEQYLAWEYTSQYNQPEYKCAFTFGDKVN